MASGGRAVGLPECLLNPPSHDDAAQCAAVAAGNVETSQRMVDVLLGALGVAAASQGTMNNRGSLATKPELLREHLRRRRATTSIAAATQSTRT